jgi:hypothetical protein
MSSLKQLAACVLAGTVASVAVAQTSPAPSLIVNNESQDVQTPMAPASGISYVQTGGSASTLKVYTDGFLFCANGPGSITREATFQPAHEDQTFSPAHPWTFPSVVDVLGVGYTGGSLSVNQNPQTTLTCHGTGPNGEVGSGLSDGIFDNGVDSKTEINYNHLINWIPTSGFSWAAPDWSIVPTDPCSTANAPAKVVEDVACAAVTGVRNGAQAPVRAATMWTSTDGVSFTYLFRVDGRFGPEVAGAPHQMQLPSSQDAATVNALSVDVRDAFDSTYFGVGNTGGQYCLLTQLPSTLNSSVCAGASIFQLNGQPLSARFYANPAPQPSSFSYYIAVTRPQFGGHSNVATPVVGVTIIADPATVAEGGDEFSGDDVLFGFMPTSTGFPWMSGQ